MGTQTLMGDLRPLALIALLGGAQPALAQQRQLGAHEHGRGTLAMVIEGARVSLELEVPAVDIVGFEHAAKTARQRAQIEQAKKRLRQPQALFKFPDAAGCVLAEASVEMEAEHDHDQATGSATGTTPDAAAERGHANFQAQYSFTCKAPARITVLEFGYFQAFAGAQKLEVSVITPKGQARFEVSGAKPRLDLGGAM